ncbi:MAG TPA: hypothetical protein VNH11_32810 [Pirellulales bacterium]|nr:hypothetical protein [Pirellulales bacterium]
MSDERRWEWLVQLDDELLMGGIMTSDFAAELIRNADLCFVHDAFVACLITCGATIETWLREEGTHGNRFVDLIDASDFDAATKTEMHALRKERNLWVHIDDPWEDHDVEEQYSNGHSELKAKCESALRLMRTVVYSTPFV